MNQMSYKGCYVFHFATAIAMYHRPFGGQIQVLSWEGAGVNLSRLFQFSADV